MKRILCLIIAVMALSFTACKGDIINDTDGVAVTDYAGNTAYLTPDSRVVSCYASLSQCWLLSGGKLVGITDDCEERALVFNNSPEIVGSTKNINVEKIVSLNPDYVILSYDLTAQRELEEILKSMNIPYGYFQEDTFEDYKNIMKQFTAVNGRDDLYEKYVVETENRIVEILSKIPDKNEGTALLLRAFSTGMKTKKDDNIAGFIINEMNLTNIVDIYPSLIEELSVEKIIAEDPDYIFITIMGDEASATAYVNKTIMDNPAWNGLSAVKNGNMYFLPQELFHYKPNEKCDDSYEYLAKIIYPDIFGEQ